MNFIQLPLADTGQYPRLLLDYVSAASQLRPLYATLPSATEVSQRLGNWPAPNKDLRHALADTLAEATPSLLPLSARKNLEALKDPQTMILCTGQQIGIGLGPLYTTFKILSLLALTKHLSEQHPQKRFVPIFWMHSEDHDLAESNRLYFSAQWHHAKLEEGGPVGLKPALPVADLLAQLEPKLPGMALFESIYRAHDTLASATQALATQLFGHHGLLVIDPMHAKLKRLGLLPLMEKELDGEWLHAFEEGTKAVEAAGYKKQLHARQTHLFYLKDGQRLPFVRDGERFVVAATNTYFKDKEELLEKATQHPERFSPSAALRPLYQQQLLGCFAYVAGPAELAYWLQLKPMFKKADLDMPVLMPRLFGAFLPAWAQHSCRRLGLRPDMLFLPPRKLRKQVFTEIDKINFPAATQQITKLFNDLLVRIDPQDASLNAYTKRLEGQAHTLLSRLENKLEKNIERKQLSRKQACHRLLQLISPVSAPQERIESLLPFLAEEPKLLDRLLSQLNPFEASFYLIPLNKP